MLLILDHNNQLFPLSPHLVPGVSSQLYGGEFPPGRSPSLQPLQPVSQHPYIQHQQHSSHYTSHHQLNSKVEALRERLTGKTSVAHVPKTSSKWVLVGDVSCRVRLEPIGANLGLLKIIFQYILARRGWSVSEESGRSPFCYKIWVEIWQMILKIPWFAHCLA